MEAQRETRIGRYPSKLQRGATWAGIWADTNPWHASHWGAKLFAKNLPGYSLYRQPGGRTPQAENRENLPSTYYEDMMNGATQDWIDVHVHGMYGRSLTGRPVYEKSFRDIEVKVEAARYRMER